MTHAAIELKGVRKTFKMRIERQDSVKRMLAQIITFNYKRSKVETREILRNVSFRIMPGEFVGIMGRNGVGKSTILKMISGIYHPNEGAIHVHGRVAPLLELGAGFNEELTGLDNIFLNAAILGYSRQQTQSRLQEVIEFSELHDHIHRPVKNYSSGMLVRLGFSIAAHLDAPILLFDEILAVGDAGFQNKCLQKIRDLHAQGRTIVLITHSADEVERHCQRCILIDNGGVSFDGSATEGARRYREMFQ
ncbi:MAG TPA: ABC transporter ATP-binding protein [Pseudobdellovibrionaceae bacterium]|nr:ABC transporter ATP-binding protein [Pseudobdellovibrionaceae bacterium]